MKVTNAIVILYDGERLSAGAAMSIEETLRSFGIVKKSSDIMMVHKDANAIASALTAQAVVEADRTHQEPREAEKTAKKAVESAIIIMGTIFAEEIQIGIETNDYSKLAVQIMLRINDPDVFNAVKTLATTKGISVPKDIIRKYKYTPGVGEVIRDVYDTMPQFHK